MRHIYYIWNYYIFISHIYKLNNQKSEVEKISGIKVTPGLSSFSEKPKESFKYLVPLLDDIKSKIPSYSIRNTEIYIYATAGKIIFKFFFAKQFKRNKYVFD